MILRAFCETSNVLQIFYFINMLVKILCYVVPAILILMLTIDIFKNVMSGEDNVIKNNMKMIVKRTIFAVAIFFVPMIVNISFGLLGNMNVSAAKCYNNANLSTIQSLKEKEAKEYEEYKAKKKEETKEKIKQEQQEQQDMIEENASSSGSSSSSFSTKNVSTKYIKSNCKIAHATSGGIGQPSGHPRGDQKGNEVFIAKNGNKWEYVARFKDPKKASIAANCMEVVAANDHIGYGRGGKHKFLGQYVYEWKELWVAAKKVNWDVSKVTTDCRTSCCPVIAVCLRAAGVTKATPGLGCTDGYSIMKAVKKTGEFTILKDKKYTKSCNNLYRGDILIKTTHAAMAT